MKDVIEEQRQVLKRLTKPLWNSEDVQQRQLGADIDHAINEAFLKLHAETDFIINRLNGEAGIIEACSKKMPKVAEMLTQTAQIMRGYAKRIENSQDPDFENRGKAIEGSSDIIVPKGFTVVPRGMRNGR